MWESGGNCRKTFCLFSGHGGSVGISSKIVGDETVLARGCVRCNGTVYEAEKLTTSAGSFHPQCFKCFTCTRGLDQVIVNSL